MDDRDITYRDQLACARRELRLRTKTYPDLVARGRQTQAWADWQLAAMQAIVSTLTILVEAELADQQTTLFIWPVED